MTEPPPQPADALDVARALLTEGSALFDEGEPRAAEQRLLLCTATAGVVAAAELRLIRRTLQLQASPEVLASLFPTAEEQQPETEHPATITGGEAPPVRLMLPSRTGPETDPGEALVAMMDRRSPGLLTGREVLLDGRLLAVYDVAALLKISDRVGRLGPASVSFVNMPSALTKITEETP